MTDRQLLTTLLVFNLLAWAAQVARWSYTRRLAHKRAKAFHDAHDRMTKGAPFHVVLPIRPNGSDDDL